MSRGTARPPWRETGRQGPARRRSPRRRPRWRPRRFGAALRQTRADEAQKFFDRARQAEIDGKSKVARIYYQMAARRASGELKQRALARLQAISSASATKVVETRP